MECHSLISFEVENQEMESDILSRVFVTNALQMCILLYNETDCNKLFDDELEHLCYNVGKQSPIFPKYFSVMRNPVTQ